MKRNPDGTFRNHNKAINVSERIVMARWLEQEVLRLKIMGFSFEQIADQVTKVARGERRSLTELPANVNFRADYRISAAGCCKACHRALHRRPNMEADELRRLITERTEQIFLALYNSVQRGDAKSIMAAIRVLDLTARINSLTNDKDSKVITIQKQPEEPENVSLESMQACFDLFHAAVDVVVESGGAPELEGIWKPLRERPALPPANPIRKEKEEPGTE